MCYSLGIPSAEKPSCLHTTLVSLVSQKSSQMVPQVSFTHTSTLPRKGSELPARRTSPLWQGAVKKDINVDLHKICIQLQCYKVMLTNTLNTSIIIVIAGKDSSRTGRALEKCFFNPWTTNITTQYRLRTLSKVSTVPWNWSCNKVWGHNLYLFCLELHYIFVHWMCL